MPLVISGLARWQKTLIKQIGRDIERVIAIRSGLIFLGSDDFDAVIAHQTTYAPVTNVHS